MTLSKEFEALEPFMGWALPLESERTRKRVNSTQQEIQEFYDVMLPLAPKVLDHLNKFELDKLPSEEKKLMLLMLGFAEIWTSIELFHQPTVPNAVPFERFRPNDESDGRV